LVKIAIEKVPVSILATHFLKNPPTILFILLFILFKYYFSIFFIVLFSLSLSFVPFRIHRTTSNAATPWKEYAYTAEGWESNSDPPPPRTRLPNTEDRWPPRLHLPGLP
jgi:hypothetical protein